LLAALGASREVNEGLMSNNQRVSRIRYCQDHQMVRYPRNQRWKKVPDDFIPELLQTDFPVDVSAQRCPRCANPGKQKAS
jgi:hypothetical protein